MLASLLAVVAAVVAFALLSPVAFGLVLGGGVILTLAGGAAVAAEARRRAAGLPEERPAGNGTAALGLPYGVVFLSAFLSLVAGAAPGMYFKDGGELASAAHALGVAHPTGFPLYLVLGKGASLAPLGGVFFRLNVLSAGATALAATAAYALARVLSPPSPRGSAAALLAPAGLLGSHGVWLHGVTTEVYALSLAGLATSLLSFACAARDRDARALALGWLLVGLGLGGHVTWPAYASFAGLVAAILVLPAIPGRRVSVVLACLALAGAGALVVLYLPAAAGRDPIANWGDPSTAGALLDHLTGRRIRESFAGEVGTFRLGLLKAHLVEVARVAWQGTGPLWPLAVAGLIRAVVRSMPMALVASALVAADWLYSTAVNPMGVRDLQTLQPAALGVSVLAASAVGWLVATPAGRAGSLAGGLAAAGVLALGMQWGASPGERDLTRVHAPREVAAGLLGSAPPGAVLLTTSDDLSAGVAGLQAVEGARPDVLVLVKQHLSDAAYVTRQVRAHAAYPADGRLLAEVALRPFEAAGETAADGLARASRLMSGRGPVFVEPGEGAVDRALVAALRPGFPVFGPRAEVGLDPVAATEAAVARALSHVPSADRWGREFIGSHLRLLGTHLALSGRDAEALGILEQAWAVAPGDPRTANNLAVLMGQAGRGAEAVAVLRLSLSESPSYLRGWRSLANLARASGMPDVAEEAEQRMRELME